jgi:hypothetical protein
VSLWKAGRGGHDHRMSGRSWRLLLEGVAVLGLLLAALSAFGLAASRVEIRKDERLYLDRTRYFAYLFLQHDVSRSEWGDNRSTHSQPMLANYVVGAWLWARGYELPPDAIPQRDGSSPNILMTEARMPMATFAIGTVGVLYLLGRALGGPVAGLTAAALMVAGRLEAVDLVQVRAGVPLMFFVLLALLLGVLGARCGRGGGLPSGWALFLGLALGLGLGTMLTAALSFLAVLSWGALTAVVAARQGRASGAGRLGRAWMSGRGWCLALLVGLGVFVGTDPHLYPDPLKHTFHLFQERHAEMVRQQPLFPKYKSPKQGDPLTGTAPARRSGHRQSGANSHLDRRVRGGVEPMGHSPLGSCTKYAVRNPLDRPGRLLRASLVDETWSGSHGLPLEAALASGGALALALAGRRGWRETGYPPSEALVLVTLLAYVIGISVGLQMAWSRYFLPTHILGSLLCGLGASAVISRRPLIRTALERSAAVART